MSRKQRIIVSITGIVLVSLILIGLTYGYYLTKIKGNTNSKSISVTTANLLLEYADVNDELITDSAVEPGKTWTKTFVATNKGNKTVTYGVALENVVNQFERKDDIVYTLDCKQYSKTGFSIDKTNKTVTGTISGTCNGVSDETTFPSIGTILVENDIADDKAQVYTLTITYKEMNVDQSVDMNKTFNAKANIVDPNNFKPYGTNTLATAIIDSAKTAASSSDATRTIYQETPTTTPGQAISTETEKTLSKTQDDYGDSYYFRGNVVDNFVNYAGMCWKIVRIEGDGSTKLILEDRSAECNSSLYTGSWDNGSTVAFGYDSNYKSDFLNYSGGLSDSLKSFQTSLSTKVGTGESLSDYLKVDDWCYDYNVVSTDSEGNQYYSAYKRIYTDKNPSLICTGTKLNKYKDNTDMYVGTLTADEMSFAGATGTSNDTHYLMNSYAKSNSLSWWGLSPSHYDAKNSMDEAFLLNYNGSLYDNVLIFSDYYGCSRPAVTLLSNIQISSGDGTQQNPYIVK